MDFCVKADWNDLKEIIEKVKEPCSGVYEDGSFFVKDNIFSNCFMEHLLLFAEFLLCHSQQFFLSHSGKHLYHLAAFEGGVNKLMRFFRL